MFRAPNLLFIGDVFNVTHLLLSNIQILYLLFDYF